MQMPLKHLLSNYKTLIAVVFIAVYYAIAVGYLPLAEGVDVQAVMALLLVPIVALVASDHADTYQFFKQGVQALAGISFADGRLNDAMKVLDKALEWLDYAEAEGLDLTSVTGGNGVGGEPSPSDGVRG